ncbi:MAG: cell division protein SepF, partial [Clostridia bacterium]|nr:cell division protein SepF [Clostridia bacterium]
HLNDKKTVVLNLEAADRDLSRRIVDFLSGATYANHGNMRKISKGTFLIVPNGVDMMGELMLEDFEENRMYF